VPFLHSRHAAFFQGRRELWTAGILLLLILCVFFIKGLMPGRVLSDASMLYQTPLYSDQMTPALTHPANSLLFDQVYQFAPWRSYTFAALRHGQWPLWNPYSDCGSSMVATYQAGVFSPLNWLLLVLPTPITYVFSAILRLWIAGFFTYLLLRRYQVAPIGAFVSALTFMFCGFNIVWLNHPQTNVVIWLPALIYGAECLITSQNKRTQLATTVWLALVIGIQFLGGHIESSVDILFAAALYFIGRWFQIRDLHRSSAASWGWGGLAVILGTMLASVQLLPFLEWLPLSAVLSVRTAHSFHLIAIHSLGNFLLQIPLLFFPNLYYNPCDSETSLSIINYINTGGALNSSNYNEWIMYVGVLGVILAWVALARCQRQPIVWLWLAIGLITLGRAMDFPIINFLNTIPVLRLENAGRLRLEFMFSVAVMVGYGVQVILEEWDQPQWQTLWSRLCGIVALIGLFLLIGHFLIVNLLVHLTAGHPLHGWQMALMELHAILSLRNIFVYTSTLVALGGLLALRILHRRSNGRQEFLAVLIGLVLTDLFSFGVRYNPVISADKFYPIPTAGAILNADSSQSRVTVLGLASLPDTQMVYHWSDIRGQDFMTHYYNQYIALTGEKFSFNSYSILFNSVRSPLLRVLNIKYVLASTRKSLTSDANIGNIRKIGDVFLGVEKTVQPRSFLVAQSVNAASDAAASNLLSQNPQAVFQRVILSAMNAPTLSASTNTTSDAVSLLRYAPEASSWRIQCNAPHYLVTTDAYYPGWNATLDGHSVPIYRANLAFRAVYIPAGDHVLRYRYQPKSVRDGAVLSLAALAIILALFVAPVFRRRFPEATLPPAGAV
jgi:hypothetical protein